MVAAINASSTGQASCISLRAATCMLASISSVPCPHEHLKRHTDNADCHLTIRQHAGKQHDCLPKPPLLQPTALRGREPDSYMSMKQVRTADRSRQSGAGWNEEAHTAWSFIRPLRNSPCTPWPRLEGQAGNTPAAQSLRTS